MREIQTDECQVTIQTLQSRDTPPSWSLELLQRACVPSKTHTVNAINELWKEHCDDCRHVLQRQLQEVIALTNLEPWSTFLIDTHGTPNFAHKLSSQDRHRFGAFDIASLSVYATVVLVISVIALLHHTRVRSFSDKEAAIIKNVLVCALCSFAFVQILTHTRSDEKKSSPTVIDFARLEGLSALTFTSYEAEYNGHEAALRINAQAPTLLHVRIKDSGSFDDEILHCESLLSIIVTKNLKFANYAKNTPSTPEEVMLLLNNADLDVTLADFYFKKPEKKITDKESICEIVLKICSPRAQRVISKTICNYFATSCVRTLGAKKIAIK